MPEYILQESAYASFSVGPGDMDHLKGILRMAETVQKPHSILRFVFLRKFRHIPYIADCILVIHALTSVPCCLFMDLLFLLHGPRIPHSRLQMEKSGRPACPIGI